jgi:hypothetical protein
MPAHNRFLEGLFAPVTEEITAFGLPVTGRTPALATGLPPTPLHVTSGSAWCGP